MQQASAPIPAKYPSNVFGSLLREESHETLDVKKVSINSLLNSTTTLSR